jgi:hypothetical protein
MIELSDAHAMAIERSCAVTAVALSGQRREGVRLVTGERREFSLSSTLDVVHVPYPSIARDWTRRTLTCGVALQCSPSKDRLVSFRLNELSARELRALTLVEASVAIGWIAANWPGLLDEARRMLGDLPALPADTDAGEMVNRAVLMSRTGAPLTVHRQAASQLRQNALDHNAETVATRTLRSGGGRRRRTEPESSTAQSASRQRPRHHTGASAGYPLPRVELLDKEFHAGSRCRS